MGAFIPARSGLLLIRNRFSGGTGTRPLGTDRKQRFHSAEHAGIRREGQGLDNPFPWYRHWWACGRTHTYALVPQAKMAQDALDDRPVVNESRPEW